VILDHCAWLDWLIRAELLTDDREDVWKELFMDFTVFIPPSVLALAVSDTKRTDGIGGAMSYDDVVADVGLIVGVAVCVGVGGETVSDVISASFSVIIAAEALASIDNAISIFNNFIFSSSSK
jgi:hypothetical protein